MGSGVVAPTWPTAGSYSECSVQAYCILPLMQDNAAAWERWVYMYAQWRQLAAMAPHIPVQNPTLRRTAYDMMLHAFLLSRADHSILLALVKDWPVDLYSLTNLTDAVLHRCVLVSDPGISCLLAVLIHLGMTFANLCPVCVGRKRSVPISQAVCLLLDLASHAVLTGAVLHSVNP